MSFELFEEDESSELMLCADEPAGRFPCTGKVIRYCGKPAFMIVLVNYEWKGGRVCRYSMNR